MRGAALPQPAVELTRTPGKMAQRSAGAGNSRIQGQAGRSGLVHHSVDGIQLVTSRRALPWQSGEIREGHSMLPASYRVNRIQKTLRWFEGDIPLLNLRVKDLSPEGQQSARQFAADLINQTRAELQRLLEEQPELTCESSEVPCEPAD